MDAAIGFQTGGTPMSAAAERWGGKGANAMTCGPAYLGVGVGEGAGVGLLNRQRPQRLVGGRLALRHAAQAHLHAADAWEAALAVWWV